MILREPAANAGSANPESKQGESEISFADTYHGKVVPLEEAAKLVTINQPVELPDLEQVVPYKKARDTILKNPEYLAKVFNLSKTISILSLSRPATGFPLTSMMFFLREVSISTVVVVCNALMHTEMLL